MIPKIIHYCWFGNNPKNKEITECLESWKNKCPDFEIKEWNELNFPIEKFPFASRCYKEKKWAFVADYARLHILYEHGGFYLDTDMLLLQSLSPLVEHNCVLGEESDGVISAGMIASSDHNQFIGACKKFYDENPNELITIPRVLSQVFENYSDKKSLTVLPPKTFYPFDSEHIKEFYGQDLGPDVMGVHLWHHSWGSPLNKFFKTIGIYSFGKKLTEVLGIKTLLKKLLGFI
ncbi:MAG: glycosyltransferase [Candidatus Paceibacterota bacterium]|jgi:mannosyltransferase OCH1-like enzyme